MAIFRNVLCAIRNPKRLLFLNTLLYSNDTMHRTLPVRLSFHIMLWKTAYPRPPPPSTLTIYPLKEWMMCSCSYCIILLNHIVYIDFCYLYMPLLIYTITWIYLCPFLKFKVNLFRFMCHLFLFMLIFIFEKQINAHPTTILMYRYRTLVPTLSLPAAILPLTNEKAQQMLDFFGRLTHSDY